jgi:hypothetical protein
MIQGYPMIFVRLSVCLLFLGLAGVAAHAEEVAFTTYPQQIVLKTESKNYTCPAWVKIRFMPDGGLFRTDFIVDSDLRGVYADLVDILTGISKSENGEYIRLYDITRKFTGDQVIIRSKADYKRDIVGDLKLAQTVESEVAFTPVYSNGVLRLKHKVLDAQLNGMSGQLGLDARELVGLVFDLLLRKEMEYRLFPQDSTVRMKLEGLGFTSRNQQFYGLQAHGSTWLTAQQFNDLLKQLSGQP